MRVNPEVNEKWRDMIGEIHIPETSHCPNQIKPICERILSMCTSLGYACPKERTMTELDKMLMVDYWNRYDLLEGNDNFKNWFVHSATEPELIRRARQWLVEHHAFWIDSDVLQHAQEAGTKFRQSIRR